MRALNRTCVAGLAGLVLAAGLARAQTPAPAPTSGEDEFTIRDSTVGYIDGALPANQLRLRYDNAHGFNRPDRAEFFYGRTGPAGPGPTDIERNVNAQEVYAAAEMAFGPRLSVFVELPSRFVHPDTAGGLSDVSAGFKYAFLRTGEQVLTFQLRAYAPTGDVHTGLSTGHASLEPALLYFRPLSERLTLEGEFRFWAPVGGTDFAGDVIRYGVGLSYDLCRTEHLRFRPVAEFVGWTVLSGKETVIDAAGQGLAQDAAGETIVNVKLGLRTAIGDRLDFYAGYGRSLTGTHWYENIVRLELRYAY